MRFAGKWWSGRTAGIGVGVVATAVTATVAIVAADGGEAQWVLADGPVKTALHTVDLPAAASREAVIPKRDTKRFSMLGVTWTDPNIDLDGTVAVRTRSVRDGGWSDWRELDVDNHFGPEPGAESVTGKARGGTDPLWVGPSDGVEVRVTATTGRTSARLPGGLRLDLVDPGEPARRRVGAAGTGARPAPRLEPVAQVRALEPTAPAPTTTTTEPAPTEPAPTTTEPAPAEPAPTTTEPAPAPTTTTAPAPATTTAPAPTVTTTAPAPPAPANPVPTPNVVTRAGWQADESIVKEPPTYGTTVKAFFVHHTAGGNTYSCAESAAIVRGIHTYHVKSNGWNDIGYNFLVDKCGTVFEGRKGGIDKPVTGAHTYGFNTDNAAIAVLGTYIDAGVQPVVQDAIAHVAAYKLGQYGNDPLGKVTLVSGVNGKYALGESVTMNRISGHRDGVATECPGTALYNQLGAIRNKAASVTGLALTGLTGTKNGTTWYTKNAFTASWSVGTPSALISRFEILVDGQVAATAPGTARSAALTVTTGAHTVQVRGVHRLGRTAATAAQPMVADPTAPTFPQGPTLSLRTGGVSTSVAPVTLSWRAADNAALRSVALTAPKAATFAPTATSWATTIKPNVTTAWSMRAQDWTGNTATASASWTPVLIPDTSATRTGTWSTTASSNHLGGSALTSTSTGASLSWTFTGRSVAFVVARTTATGQAHIYVDGVKVSTVDTRAGTTYFRQIVWTKTWASSGRHTVKIVVAGTSGRPRVITDGLVYVR